MPDPQKPALGQEVSPADLVPVGGEVSEADLESSPAAASPVTDEHMGAIGRGLSAFWDQINPIAAVEGVSQAVQHPLATAQAIGQAQAVPYERARDAFSKGDYVSGAIHGLNYLLPIIGPQLDEAGEKGKRGDIAGMVGQSVGLGLAVTGAEGAKAIGAGVKAAIPASVAERVASAADAGATARLANVMSPKVGPNKVRFGNMAEKVAPQLAREPGLGALSREGFAEAIGGKLSEAEAQLDAANTARPATPIPTAPILADLQAQKARLATAGGRVPEPYAARAEQIDKAIKEVRRLGASASYNDLRLIRQAYDGPAKAIYSPTMTADFMLRQGEKQGAADVTGVLRKQLASADPQTADANARYSLFKNAQDVLDATAETERTRPKVGRQMMARGVGTATGGELGGVKGALVGYVLGPILDSAMSSGVTTQIATARIMAEMADALRAGNPAKASANLVKLAVITGKTAQLRAALGGQMTVPGAVPALAQDQPATQP